MENYKVVTWQGDKDKNPHLFAIRAEFLSEIFKKDNPGKIALISRCLEGSVFAPSKKRPTLRASFAWLGRMFKEPEQSLSTMLNSPVFAIILVDKDKVPEDILKELQYEPE